MRTLQLHQVPVTQTKLQFQISGETVLLAEADKAEAIVGILECQDNADPHTMSQ